MKNLIIIIFLLNYFSCKELTPKTFDSHPDQDEVIQIESETEAEARIYCWGDNNTISIDENIDSYSWTMSLLGDQEIPAQRGSTSEADLSLVSNLPNMAFNWDIQFFEEDSEFIAQLQITVEGNTFLWEIYASEGECSYVSQENVDNHERFINSNFTDLSMINEISKFRSGYGHDYSDSTESCRSMKHYFSPPVELRYNETIPVIAPFDGIIVHRENETMGELGGDNNQKVILRSIDHPHISVVLFHIDVFEENSIGTIINAQDPIGHARFERADGSTAHDFDIAVHANTDSGPRMISYLNLITPSLINEYLNWSNVGNMDEFIIPRQQRDSTPMQCEGESFVNNDPINSWVSH